jgi:hypothetical protein
MTNAAKIQSAMSNLYKAMSEATDAWRCDDEVLAPIARSALRIYIDRLYAALDTPLDDGEKPSAQLKFRTMAGAAASHAETLLAWSEAKV